MIRIALLAFCLFLVQAPGESEDVEFAGAPLVVVCWRWGHKYTGQHVNILRDMVRRHLHTPHEFACITDKPDGIASDIRIIPLWKEYRRLGGCWTRLKAFSAGMAEVIGPRFCSIDLDCVIVGDITPLLMRPEPFVISASNSPRYPENPYSGTMFMMSAGARERVWTEFLKVAPPLRTTRLMLDRIIKAGRKQGLNGTDSLWFGLQLGKNEATWGRRDGIFSFPYDVEAKAKLNGDASLPPGARIILFHGRRYDPANRKLQFDYPWINEHWRQDKAPEKVFSGKKPVHQRKVKLVRGAPICWRGSNGELHKLKLGKETVHLPEILYRKYQHRLRVLYEQNLPPKDRIEKPVGLPPDALRIVCWKWNPVGRRALYTYEHVNRLYNMLKRNLRVPFEMVCVTDDIKRIDPAIRCVHTRRDLANWRGCFRRLRAFAPEASQWLGQRFVSMDLDCVILRDVTDLFARTEDFVILRDGLYPRQLYNGSLWMMTAGARAQAWTQFNYAKSPHIAKKKGFIGTDQAWLSYILGPDQPVWTTADGIYSFRWNVLKSGLPDDARIVFFHGKYDPSQKEVQRKYPWIQEHWR